MRKSAVRFWNWLKGETRREDSRADASPHAQIPGKMDWAGRHWWWDFLLRGLLSTCRRRIRRGRLAGALSDQVSIPGAFCPDAPHKATTNGAKLLCYFESSMPRIEVVFHDLHGFD
jgi:hypothetical protein